MENASTQVGSGDIDIVYFKNLRELISYLDQLILDNQRKAEAINKDIEALKSRVDKFQALQRIIEELIEKNKEVLPTAIELTGLKIYIDPRPTDEYDILKEGLDAIMDRNSVLKKVRDVVDILQSKVGQSDTMIVVEMRNGVPTKIVFRGW
ncbi:hypothetical protein GCM10007981_17920 [Thermocladium modestius]|uniref:Uncharacterized protein n=1 Tax=Thermocladium modestius TaxID=62609 RepID=A0A830GVL5_9CREN|nr:hypothetical protein [Thermocladium modestius]GGP22322.1 hypothetical protein GCM10007981_17920 [Thermocladium modestius]